MGYDEKDISPEPQTVATDGEATQQDWTYPLMNSNLDIVGTCIAVHVPCLQHGQIVEKMGWGGCVTSGLLYGCAWLGGCTPCVNLWRRENMRRAMNIKGNIADDILSSYVFGVCALVQEYHQALPNSEGPIGAIAGAAATLTKAAPATGGAAPVANNPEVVIVAASDEKAAYKEETKEVVVAVAEEKKKEVVVAVVEEEKKEVVAVVETTEEVKEVIVVEERKEVVVEEKKEAVVVVEEKKEEVVAVVAEEKKEDVEAKQE